MKMISEDNARRLEDCLLIRVYGKADPLLYINSEGNSTPGEIYSWTVQVQWHWYSNISVIAMNNWNSLIVIALAGDSITKEMSHKFNLMSI